MRWARLIFISLFFGLSLSAQGEETPPHLNHNHIWPIRKFWTTAEERNYARWLSTKVKENLFEGSGLRADCADFALALRWIYAHDNGLPASATLPGNFLWGTWHSSDEWDRLPSHSEWKKDERFKAALKFLFKATYTHSVLDDLYPVRVSPEFVTGGTLILNLWQSSGHTRTITQMAHSPTCPDRRHKCLQAIAGSEPASAHALISTDLPGPSPEGQGGLMRFRWPVRNEWGQWLLTPPQDMPGYSREQYEWREEDFTINLFVKLGMGRNATDTYAQLVQFLVGQLYSRVQVTAEGFYLCALVPCSSGSDLESRYSTPQRDHRLRRHIQTLKQVYRQVPTHSPEIDDLRARLNIPLLQGLPITYRELLDGERLERLKHTAQLNWWERWGENEPTAESQFALHLQSFQLNWLARSTLVRKAVKACRSPGNDLICNPKSEAIQALSTERWDQGFRQALRQIQALYQHFGATERQQIDEDLRRQSLDIALCGTASNPRTCTLHDLLLAEPEHLEKMSSEPSDSLKARYGF